MDLQPRATTNTFLLLSFFYLTFSHSDEKSSKYTQESLQFKITESFFYLLKKGKFIFNL